MQAADRAERVDGARRGADRSRCRRRSASTPTSSRNCARKPDAQRRHAVLGRQRQPVLGEQHEVDAGSPAHERRHDRQRPPGVEAAEPNRRAPDTSAPQLAAKNSHPPDSEDRTAARCRRRRRPAPDIARDLSSVDRNRQSAQTHIDHMNSTHERHQDGDEVDAAEQEAHRDERRDRGEQRRSASRPAPAACRSRRGAATARSA